MESAIEKSNILVLVLTQMQSCARACSNFVLTRLPAPALIKIRQSYNFDRELATRRELLVISGRGVRSALAYLASFYIPRPIVKRAG